MKIKSLYDKIGLSSLGAGLDGLFIHSDLTSWMDKLAPYLLLIIIKILLIAIGLYLLYLYNKSETLNAITLDKEKILTNKILLAIRVSQYHWYLLILLCFLSISMNWGDEPGSGGDIAFFILILWLIIVWPIIYFWNVNNANNVSSLSEITDKYVSSKTFNLPRLILLSVLFLPLGFFFSYFYAYLMWFNPFPPYFNFIATVVLGVLIGFVFPIKLSKCTNSKVAIFSILIFALVCHYFGWITWMDLYINKGDVIEFKDPRSPIPSIVPSSSNLDQILYLLTNPAVFFSNISIIPQGFMEYVIWILELLIILYFSAFTSYERSNEPFSIAKNKWLESFKIQLSYISILESLKNAIINADEIFFENMTQAEKEESFTEFEVWHFGEEQAYLTVKNHKKRIDEKGKIKYDEQELIKYAKIDSKILSVLRIKSSPNSVQAP